MTYSCNNYVGKSLSNCPADHAILVRLTSLYRYSLFLLFGSKLLFVPTESVTRDPSFRITPSLSSP